jgi:hypothetical protein
MGDPAVLEPNVDPVVAIEPSITERGPILLDSIFPKNGLPMSYNLGYESVQLAYMGRNYIWTLEEGGWHLVRPDEIPSDMPYRDVIPELEITISEAIYDRLLNLNSIDVTFNTEPFLGFIIHSDDWRTSPETVLQRLYMYDGNARPNYNDINSHLRDLEAKTSEIQTYRLEGLIFLYESSGFIASTWYGLETQTGAKWYDDKVIDFFTNNFKTDSAAPRPSVFTEVEEISEWLRTGPDRERDQLIKDLEGSLRAFWASLQDLHEDFYEVATECFGRAPRNVVPLGDWDMTFQYETLPGMRMEVAKGKTTIFFVPAKRRRNDETKPLRAGDKVQIEGRSEVFIVSGKYDDVLTVDDVTGQNYDLPRFIFSQLDQETELTSSDLDEFLASADTSIDLPGPTYTFGGNTYKPYQWGFIGKFRYFLCYVNSQRMEHIYAPLLFDKMTLVSIPTAIALDPPPSVITVRPPSPKLPTGPDSTTLAVVTVGLFALVYFMD